MDLALTLPPGDRRGARLREALREAILSGRLSQGTRLPPTRALAAQLGVSRGTVVAVYEELVGDGYCVGRTGAGTYVAVSPTTDPPPERPAPRALSVWARALAADAPARQDDPGSVEYDFRYGVAPEGFPAAALTRALRHAADRLAAERGPGDPAGSPRLRAALAGHLARTRGLRATAAQVLIVSGAQQGLDLAARVLLDPGDGVAIEHPYYPRAARVFRALGARLHPVAVDQGGVRPDRLPATDVRLLYVTPSHQYPTGAVLAPDRRIELLQYAERHNAWVLEDDYDSEFRYAGPPLPCLQGLDHAGRCVYLGSLSKLLHPALRLGYLVAPPALVPAITAAKGTLDQATTPILQDAIAELFESGEVERHLRRTGRLYRARRARLLAALAGAAEDGVHVWPASGGLHVFVEIDRADPSVFQEEVRRRGVAVSFADDCYLERPEGVRLILWFSRIEPERIGPGIAAVRAAARLAVGNTGR